MRNEYWYSLDIATSKDSHREPCSVMPRGAARGIGSRGRSRRGQGPYTNTRCGGRHLAASPSATGSPADSHISDLYMKEFLRLICNISCEDCLGNPPLRQVDTGGLSLFVPGCCCPLISRDPRHILIHSYSPTRTPWAHSCVGAHVGALFTTAHKRPT